MNPPPPTPTPTVTGGRWLYPLLLAVETFGVFVIYWKGLPLYRQVVVDPGLFAPQNETLRWGLFGTALIQITYWTRYHIRPASPPFVNVLLGHIVLFLSELVFILAAATFSFVFITQELAARISLLRYVVLLGSLFSLFCYMEELQRLGRRLLGSFGSTNKR